MPPQNWTFNWINHSIIRIARLLSSLGFDFQHMSHLLFIKEKEDIIFCFAQAVNVFISHYFHFFPQCRICIMFGWKGPKQMLHFIDLAFSIYNLDIKIDPSKFIHKFIATLFSPNHFVHLNLRTSTAEILEIYVLLVCYSRWLKRLFMLLK